MFSYFSRIFFNRRYLNIFVFLTYFICSIIIFRVILPLDGTIGFFHDWPFGPFPEMIQSYGQSGSYIWNSQQGKSLYPTDWIFKEFISIFSIIYLNGETLTKSMLIFLITFSGYGAFFLSRKLGLGHISSFLTGFIYIFTPVMFTRIIAGFIYYLISYMLTPFIVAYFIQGSKVQKNISSSRIGIIFRKYTNFVIAGLLFVFSVQIQFYILVPILLVIIWLIVFRNKQSFIGIVIILSIAFIITIFPFFISSGISKISFDQRQLFDPEFLLNSYSEILKSPNFYEAFRLLGYTTHPYSYTNLGTLDDPLFFKTLSTKIINHEYPNLINRVEFSDPDSNQTISGKSFHLYAQWINSTEKCDDLAFSCVVLDKNDTDVIEEIDSVSSNLIVDSLSNKILKVSSIENNDIGSNIISKEIPVQHQNYVIMTNLKTNNYSINSHVALEGFNETSGTWKQITQCPSGLDGQSPWTRYMCYVSPASSSTDASSISKIRLVLNAGWSLEQGKEAVTYFGNMYITPVQNNSLIIPDWIFDLNIVIPVIGFSSLILYKKNKFVIALAFISLIGLFLLKGTNPPFSNVFEFLFVNGLYIFREVWHLAFLYGFGIIFLIGFFIDKVVSHRNIVNTKIITNISILKLKSLVNKISNKYFRIGISVFLTAIIITSNGYPLLTGTFGGYLQTYSFSEEYHNLFKKYTQSSDYNVLILPLFGPIQYGDLNISGIDPLLTYSGNNLFYSFPFSSSNTLTSWTSLWLHSIMLENKTTNFGSILSGFGIKYIIWREDFTSYFPDYIMLGTYQPFRDKWYSSLEPFLDSQKDLAIVENTSNFKVYENTNYASKFFVPQIDLPQFSSYDDLLKLSDAYPLSNFSTYPINSKHYINKSDNIDETNYVDFINLGKYTVSNNPLEWTTNKIWFGYDYLLGSRYHTGAFIIGSTVNGNIILNDEKNLPTLDFDLPLEDYKNKHIQIWLKALEWPEGGNVEVDIYDKNKNNSFSSSPDLYSDISQFSLVKLFDGLISENKTYDYGFKVSNLQGNNYLEGLYILDIDSLTGEKTTNDTSINKHVLDLAINKHAEYIFPLDYLINNVSSTSNKTFFNNHIDQNSNQGLNLILNPVFKKLISDTDAKNFVNISNSSYHMNINKDVFLGPNFNTSKNSSSDHNVQSFPLGWTDYSNNCNSESGSFICKVIKQPLNSNEITDRNTNHGYENNSKSIFQVSTNTTVPTSWSHIGSNEVSVSEGQSYSIHASLRLNDFVRQSHVVIEGFDDELNGWFTLTQCPPGVDGPLDWTTFICTVDIHEPISKIRLVLNAGWTSQPGKQAITNFTDIGLFKIDKTNVYESDFNNMIPYNYLNNISSIMTNADISNKRLENSSIVPMETKSAAAANVFNFTKVDPTLWKVTINESFAQQDDSWTLAFAEAFDPLWQAQIYNNGSLLQISNSKPLYGAINGFEINLDSRNDTDEGNIDIVIRYLPQELFEFGTKISLIILFLLGLLLVITILYRKKEN